MPLAHTSYVPTHKEQGLGGPNILILARKQVPVFGIGPFEHEAHFLDVLLLPDNCLAQAQHYRAGPNFARLSGRVLICQAYEKNL